MCVTDEILIESLRKEQRCGSEKLLNEFSSNGWSIYFITAVLQTTVSVVCLNHLYTANRKPAGSMQLRHRGHNFALPTIHLEFNKRHFVARVLFDYV